MRRNTSIFGSDRLRTTNIIAKLNVYHLHISCERLYNKAILGRINDIALFVRNVERFFMVDFKVIGARVKFYRQKAGLTQQALSDLMEVSSSYISQIERGLSEVSIRRLDKIAGLIGTNLQSLVADANSDSQDFMMTEVSDKMSTLSADEKRQVVRIIDTFLTK